MNNNNCVEEESKGVDEEFKLRKLLNSTKFKQIEEIEIEAAKYYDDIKRIQELLRSQCIPAEIINF